MDTSALLLLYLERESQSAFVLEQFQAASALIVSELSLTEARSALAQRKSRKAMTGAHYSRARTRFLEQWPTLSRVPIHPTFLEQAAQLCEKHPALRALDGIHIATALELSQQSNLRFLTFDLRQLEVARLELGVNAVVEIPKTQLEG